MLGIVGSVTLMDKYPEMFSGCWSTGKNFKQNFVVSGRVVDILNLEKELSQKNIIFQRLPVNYGFHTPLMDTIEQHVNRCAGGLNWGAPKIPIVSCVSAGALEAVDTKYIWEVIRTPVWFEAAIGSMLNRTDCLFIDTGPSGTLSTAVKYMLPHNSNSRYFPVIDQFGQNLKSFAKLKSELVH